MSDEPDDLFNVSSYVLDFEAQMAGYRAASDATRANRKSMLDVRYGDGPRQKLDLFFPPGEAMGRPIHMFIHGGYWRRQVKEDYAFAAEGAIAAGAIGAIVEYTLMPEVRMARLVADVRAAAHWLVSHAAEFGGDGTKLSASGHSAGGHLCSYLGARAPHEPHAALPGVRSLILMSGIYDLRPITTSYLQPELHLTPEEVAQWSPFEAVPEPGIGFELVVGHKETEPFHTQAQDYAFALERRGVSAERITAAGHDHMSLVRELGQPGRPMAELIRAAVERSSRV